MVTADDLHMTKSHLLRRLLQRRVEMLEAEKSELRTEISALEERLQLAQNQNLPAIEGMEDVVEETLDSIRILTEQAKNEADYTMKVTRHEQEKLILEMTNLQRENERLRKLLLESMEGINAIQEQAQTRTSLLVKEAHLQQEKLIVEVQHLYNQNGRGDSVALASRQKKAFAIRNRAEEEVSRLTTEARVVRERLLEDLSTLQQESAKLQETMARVIQRAHTISESTYLGASRVIEETLPENLRRPPTVEVVDPQAEVEVEPERTTREKRSVPWWSVVLFLVFVIALGLPLVADMLPQPSQDLLFDYRYLIWICAGPLTYWLLSKLRSWDLDARTSKWDAERDYALWRIRNALFALALLIPLLVLTTAIALRSTY